MLGTRGPSAAGRTSPQMGSGGNLGPFRSAFPSSSGFGPTGLRSEACIASARVPEKRASPA